MKRDDLYDLAAFAVVAEKASFTRAAAELGMSQSALSHAIKLLEERMSVRLLSRTTRSVSVTDAGEMLLRSLKPALQDISSGVDAVSALRSNAISAKDVRVSALGPQDRGSCRPMSAMMPSNQLAREFCVATLGTARRPHPIAERAGKGD